MKRFPNNIVLVNVFLETSNIDRSSQYSNYFFFALLYLVIALCDFLFCFVLLSCEALWFFLLNFVESVDGKDWTYFSALCWMFGRRLYERYGIPIGLISSNYRGTRVEAWSSPETNSRCAERYRNHLIRMFF